MLPARSTDGSMVSVLPDSARRVLVAASKDSITVPAAFFRKIVPVPCAMASLKVSTMLLPTATAVASSAGLKLTTTGAVVSAVLVACAVSV